MIKKYILAIVILFNDNNLYARKGRPEELFQSSDISIIITVVFALIIGALFIYTWIDQNARGEKEKDTNSVGCLGLIAVVSAIAVIMSKCS